MQVYIMEGIKSFFRKQYGKVFTSKRMTFSDRLFLVLPKLPSNVANLMILVVMFKYFTDVVGLDPLMVGSIFMVLSIWNAVNDPIIGILLDRMPYLENRGKYIYIAKLMAPIIGISMLCLLFADKSWQNWVIYTYILAMFIVYEAGMTAYHTATSSYIFLRLRNSEERMEYSVLLTYLTYILSALVTMIPLIMFVGDQPVTYITPVMITIITLNAFFFWASLWKLKDSPEYYNDEFVNSDAQLAKDILRYTKDIIKSKGFWLVNILSYLFHMSVAYYFTFYLYYMDNIINATSTQSVVIDLSNGLITFMIIPFIPAVYRKFGTKRAYALMVLPGIFGFIGLYFANNIWTVFLSFALIVITHGSQMTINGPTVSLVIDEDWQRTGTRKVGYIGALSALVIKPANGIRAFIFGAVLSYFGYDGTLAVQSPEAISGLRIASSIIPLISLVIAFIIIQFLPYNRKVEDQIIAKRKEMEDKTFVDTSDETIEEIYDFE